MAKKKTGSASDKQDKAAIRKLAAKLERAEAKAEKWKAAAKRAQAEAATLKTRAATLDKKLVKAKAAARQTTAVDVPAPQSAAAPDDSWTVAQLRAEARSRKLTGLSNKTKAELLAALG